MSDLERYYSYYDLFYQDKDYLGECDFIESVLAKYAGRQCKDMLDIGCGAGGHAIPLAARGYGVTGVDVSSVMLEKAGARAAARNVSLNLHHGDIRDFNLDRSFDACIGMFAVVGYLTETGDVLQTLRNVRRHLREGSLFLFDFWNGLAVMRQLPEVRARTFEDKDIRVIRMVRPELDAINHICNVNYHIIALRDDKVLDEVKETHVIRFFFPREMQHYLEECGFKVLKVCPFPKLDGQADENTWNVAMVAQVTGGGKQ